MIEHYENHSSAIKKNNAIIRKIEKEGSDLHMTGKWCACSAPSVYL